MVILHDNARPHVKASVVNFLNGEAVILLKQPAYSPDFNFCDRWVFSKLENARRFRSFKSKDEINQFVKHELNGITADELNHQFDKLCEDPQQIINNHGDCL